MYVLKYYLPMLVVMRCYGLVYGNNLTAAAETVMSCFKAFAVLIF